jgi:hypothetical protein
VILDDWGRRTGGLLRRAAERIGPAPDPRVVVRRRRRASLARTALVLAAMVLATTLVWRELLPTVAPAAPQRLGQLDPRVVAAIEVGQPGRRDADTATPLVAADARTVWVLDASNRAVLVIDPDRNLVSRRIGISLGDGWEPAGVWAIDGSAWVLNVERSDGATGGAALQRIDPGQEKVAETDQLPPASFSYPPDLVGAGGALWLTTDHGTLWIDQRSGLTKVLPAPAPGQVRLAAAGGRVWASGGVGHVGAMDPRSGGLVGRVVAPTGGSLASDVAAADGSLWVLAEGGVLWRLALPSGQVKVSLSLGEDFGTNPTTVVAAGDTVAAVASKALYLIDARSAKVRAEVRLEAASSVAIGAGAIWVADAYHGLLLRVDPFR